MSRMGSGMYAIMVVALIIAGVLTLVKNPYKSHYKREEPVSYEEAMDDFDYMAGYPAGEDIPIARSIEDIMNNECCTIEVSKENLESIRFFLIKDGTEAGNHSQKVGRRYSFSYVAECYALRFDFGGDFNYAIRQILWNLEDTSYGEWCIATLESGERILVLVDLKLLDIPKKEKIKLPIGRVIDNYYIEDVTDNNTAYNLTEENATWYLDMVGNWEEDEVGDIDVTGRFCFTFLVIIAVIVYAIYKSAVKDDPIEEAE